MDSFEQVTLQSSDGKQFAVEMKIAKMSTVIAALIEGVCVYVRVPQLSYIICRGWNRYTNPTGRSIWSDVSQNRRVLQAAHR